MGVKVQKLQQGPFKWSAAIYLQDSIVKDAKFHTDSDGCLARQEESPGPFRALNIEEWDVILLEFD